MSVLEAFKLEDQVSVVTGAGAGIGRAIAELFSKAGAKVIVSDLKKEAAQKVADIIQESGGTAAAGGTGSGRFWQNHDSGQQCRGWRL